MTRRRGGGRLVVVSDLDGTLLTADDYDPGAALPMIERLRAAGIPLVLASSKTRVEMEAWRRRLGIYDPFIIENGGALLWPVGCDPPPPDGSEIDGPYARVIYGTAYALLRDALPRLAGEAGVRLDGFGDVSGTASQSMRRRRRRKPSARRYGVCARRFRKASGSKDRA
jgi:mannosyl-3-phosphoglycerate phosphatase